MFTITTRGLDCITVYAALVRFLKHELAGLIPQEEIVTINGERKAENLEGEPAIEIEVNIESDETAIRIALVNDALIKFGQQLLATNDELEIHSPQKYTVRNSFNTNICALKKVP